MNRLRLRARGATIGDERRAHGERRTSSYARYYQPNMSVRDRHHRRRRAVGPRRRRSPPNSTGSTTRCSSKACWSTRFFVSRRRWSSSPRRSYLKSAACRSCRHTTSRRGPRRSLLPQGRRSVRSFDCVRGAGPSGGARRGRAGVRGRDAIVEGGAAGSASARRDLCGWLLRSSGPARNRGGGPAARQSLLCRPAPALPPARGDRRRRQLGRRSRRCCCIERACT